MCDEPNCNANNDVEMLFSQTDSDDNLVYRRCFFYSSESDEQFNPTQPGVGDLGACPIFANQGCFAASSTTQFHRGCSPFPVESFAPQCTGDSCYQICNSDACNRDKIRNPVTCHVCNAAFDHMGKELGNYSPECVNIQDDRFLTECALEFDHCESVTKTDWNLEGSQVYLLERRCGKNAMQDQDYTTCTQAQSGIIEYKDCYNICYGQGCNNNNDVDLQHTKLDENGTPVELECFEYSLDTGTRSQNNTAFDSQRFKTYK